MTTITKLKDAAAVIAQLKTLFSSRFDARTYFTLAEEAETNLRAVIAEMEAGEPVQDVEKDAARYRYLRSQHWTDNTWAVVHHPRQSLQLGSYCPNEHILDADIDAAIKDALK